MIKTHHLTAGVYLFTLVLASGCQQPNGDLLDRLVIGEVMTHSQFATNLRALSVPGGRLTGTPGAEQAQEYVANKLREYGLQNVHAEPFEIASWIVRETEVTLLTDPPRTIEGAIALGRTLSTPPEGITAELVYLGQPTEGDFAARAADLAGRLVLVDDKGLRRGQKLKLALEQGAVGLVVMSQPQRAPIIGNGHHEPRPEPIVAVPYDQQLLDALAAGQSLKMRLRYVTENWTAHPCNIVGEIPGSGPQANEVIMLTAHLDSWHLAEGAMDNGSGSATILETARALATLDWKPRRTIRFVWFMGEELGLCGSRAYVERHLDELDNVVALCNLDMPGEPRSLLAFGHPEVSALLDEVRGNLAGYELDLAVREPSGDWSDHAPFMRQGVCTLTIAGELGPGSKYYHTAGDVYDTVDRRGTVSSAAVLAVIAHHFADAPSRPAQRLAPLPADE